METDKQTGTNEQPSQCCDLLHAAEKLAAELRKNSSSHERQDDCLTAANRIESGVRFARIIGM